MGKRMSIRMIDGCRVEDFQDPRGEWGCVVTDPEKTFMSVTSHQITKEAAIEHAMLKMRERKNGEKTRG